MVPVSAILQERKFLAIISFLKRQGKSDEEIKEDISDVYGEEGPSKLLILKWIRQLNESIRLKAVKLARHRDSPRKKKPFLEESSGLENKRVRKDSTSDFMTTEECDSQNANNVITESQIKTVKQLVADNPKITSEEVSEASGIPEKDVCLAMKKLGI